MSAEPMSSDLISQRPRLAGGMMRGAGVLALVFAALSACATSPTPEEKTPAPVTEEMGAVPPSLDTFEGYLADLKLRARARGIDDAIIRETLQPVEERVNIASVIEDARRLDQNQAEFVKRVWTYLDTAASDTRVTTGRAKSAEFSAELASIQDDYGVDAPWLVAIWGLESNYGSFIGNHDVPTALAALAFDGRRRALFEGELFAVFDILRSGAARRGDLIGGWAGAMGQTQFMPSTYVTYARDFDGDGRKDVWGNTGDALASAAHLLSERGWTSGEPWGVEVALPDDFDYMLADGRDLTVAAWKAAGVAALPGKPIPDALLNRPAELLLPGGAAGPAFGWVALICPA